MATIRVRGNTYHIQWYDPFEKKIKSMATNLIINEANLKKVNKYAKQLQEKISKDYRKQKEIGIQRVTLDEAFSHFKRNNQNKHPKTQKDYDRFYKKFTETFNKDIPATSINKLNIENWLLEIKRLKLSQNTIHGYGKQLNHFLNFLFEYNYTQMFKINREVKTRPEVKEKIIFTDEDLTIIIKNLRNKNFNFQTSIYLLAYTGLRPSDLLSFQVNDIDIKNRVIKYYSPKRKKYREIVFHEKLLPVIIKRLKETKEGHLLNYGNTENFGKAIKRYFKHVELDGKKYSARTFRKTFVSLCRSRYNMDASIVMELVGHEHTSTTDKYYNKISYSIMKEELKKFVLPFVKLKNPKTKNQNTMANTMAECDNLLKNNKLRLLEKAS